MDKEIKELIERIETLGWNVRRVGAFTYLLSKFSQIRGQHFNIIIEGETVERLIDNLKQVYNDYDISYEANIWLDSMGYGTGSAYESRVEDAFKNVKECEQMILDLYSKLAY